MRKPIISVENRVNRPKPLLLFIYPNASAFVRQDASIFSEFYQIREISFQPKLKAWVPFSLLLELVFILRSCFSVKVIICQFAGYHTLIPVFIGRIFSKPCIIIVGGTDCTSMPSINYGNLRKPLLRWATLWSLKYSSHIISPASSLIECEYTFTRSDYPKQGYRYFDKSITTPFTIIYNAVDINKFKILRDVQRKKNTFLTICTAIDKRTFRLKGIDLFIKMAETFPEYEFTIIGQSVNNFIFDRPANVRQLNNVNHEMLPAIMAQHSFYCQLSMSEGFGLALAEAMACGCVPIVSKVGIMDFIVGESGFILERRDSDLLKSIVISAVSSKIKDPELMAHGRIKDNFSLARRRVELLTLLNKLTSKVRN